MSFWGRLFGSSDTVKTTVEMARDAGDAMFYTEEERAQASAERREWWIRFMEATTPQALTRRLLACSVVYVWLALVVIGVVAFGFELWLGAGHQGSQYVATQIDKMEWPVGLIMVFYFAPDAIGTAWGRIKGKGG